MKVHIVKSGEDHIEGYKRLEVTPQGLNLQGISPNECSFILAGDALDLCDNDNIGTVLQQIVSIMRLGSTAVIGRTDIRQIARAVINNLISPSEANHDIGQTNSMIDFNTVSSAMKNLGLSIITTKVVGAHYEIEVSR